MTTKEKLHSMLVSNGMFPSQATSVLDLAIPEIESLTPNYKITWDRPSDEYPDNLYLLWYMTVKPIALKWVEKNLPMAWFKPMFED